MEPPPRPPPVLPDEIVEEILLRFPPDDPASLLRAALVCKRWCRLVAGGGFRRRFRHFHRTPPMLVLVEATRPIVRGSMVTDVKAMAVVRAARPALRGPHDGVAFAAHAAFLAAGYSLCAVGPNALTDPPPSGDEEVGIDGWNSIESCYAFLYSKEEKGKKKRVLVKCHVIGDLLAIDVLVLEAQDKGPHNIQINVKDFFSEEQPKNYGDMYKNFAGLIETVNSNVLCKLDGKDDGAVAGNTPDAASSSSMHSSENPGPRTTDPSSLIYPPIAPLGSEDLFPGPGAGPVEEASKTYVSVLRKNGIGHQAIANKVTMGAVESQQSVPVVEKSNEIHHVASVLEDEEFILEGAERAKLEADFEKALQELKPKNIVDGPKRSSWNNNANELFWKICQKKIKMIESIPKGEWIGNPIITDIGLELFHRTKKAYTNKQLFDKWKNMRNTLKKKDLKSMTAGSEESEHNIQQLIKELGQLKIHNKEDKEKCQDKQMLIEKITHLEGELNMADAENTHLEGELNVAEAKIAHLEGELNMAKAKITHLEGELNMAEALRRGMLNKILELKGKIRVFCRVRPAIKENESQNNVLLSFPSTGPFIGSRVYMEHQGVKVCFTCDRVFDPTASQDMIFREIQELVQSALDGKKVCIFGYGQIGSGKTYTMLGNDGDATKGIIPRALKKIFETAESRESHGSIHTIKISMIEIYNGKTRNLSSMDEAEVKTTTEALEALKKSLSKRSVAKTTRNDKSSRSHFIFKLSIYSYDKEKNMSEGILSIIDLAGSEQPEANASEEQKIEATEINKSLLSLGIMINAIESGLAYSNHRDSKLTEELKTSLEDSKVLMFVNVAPEEACFDETNATFDFAARIKSCTKMVKHEKKANVMHDKMVFKSPGVLRGNHGKNTSVLKSLSRQGLSFRKNFDVAPSCKKRKMYIND